MALPVYPRPGFEDYNNKARSGVWKPGKFGVALDVWRGDGTHLWRSYTLSQAEHMDVWLERNKGHRSVGDVARCPVGVGGAVPAIDRFPIPRRSAFWAPMTLRDIVAVMRGVLAIAQLPHKPKLESIPASTAISQRMYKFRRDWVRVTATDPFTDTVMRAIVGAYAMPPALTRSYVVTLEEIKPEGAEVIQTREFKGSAVRLESVDATSIVARSSAEALGVGGEKLFLLNAAPTNAVFRVVGCPRLLRIVARPVPESDRAVDLGGFDLPDH